MKPLLPARRRDVRRGRAGSTSVLVDPVVSITYATTPLVQRIWQVLHSPISLEALCEVLGDDPADIDESLRFLFSRSLLETPLAIANAQVSRETTTAPNTVNFDTVEFSFSPRLKHACQACGSCCSATDVGPISATVADDLRAQDWSYLPGFKDTTDPFLEITTKDDEVAAPLVLRKIHDQCVFLNDRGLCEVHSVLGAQRKPTPCRQFPYVFAQDGPRIRVSLQMECRAYDRAKEKAPPLESQTTELRDLLKLGAPIHQLPTTLRADLGALCSNSDYTWFEESLIQALRKSDASERTLTTPFSILTERTEALFQRIRDKAGANEQHTAQDYVYRYTDFYQTTIALRETTNETHRAEFIATFTAFCEEAYTIAQDRGLPHLARRFGVLISALNQLDHNHDSLVFDHPKIAQEILTDVFVSGVASRDIIRHCRDIRTGVAWLSFRSWLILQVAHYKAQSACRIRCRTTDLIDSMVTVCKMLRERAVLEFIDSVRHDLVAVFSMNLESLTNQTAPKEDRPGGMR